MKKIIILITALLLLQGCSSNSTNSNIQFQNLTNSVEINQLEKTEFDTKNNKLIIFTSNEVINEKEFELILNTLKLNSFNGNKISFNEFSSEKFDNKDFTVDVISKNNNTLSFSTKNIKNISYNMSSKKYSNDFIKSKIKSFSKDVLTFNEFVGTIETDLSKGRNLGNKVDKFTEVKQSISNDIKFLRSLSNSNTDFNKLSELDNNLSKIEKLLPEVESVVDKALSIKNGSSINSVFLHINDIDKFARELENI